MTTSNHYRKAKALVAKTTNNGCTPDEAASALQTASDIITKHNLDPARIDWRAASTGYRIVGELGRGATFEKDDTTDEPRKPSSRKKATRHHTPGEPTQSERMMELLQRPEGATLDEICEALDVQPHSARALISTHARRKLGLTVKAEKGRYRIV